MNLHLRKVKKDHSSDFCALLDQGTNFEGHLSFDGVMRLGGRFKGTIYTPGTLIIAETAQVEAKVNASVVIIAGTFQGTINAGLRVEVRKPAHFTGSITSPSLTVEEGVSFQGETKIEESTAH